MIRSMFTAISSLSLHQKYLDVVSNNLANANTNGYKSSRVLFQDQFSQMMNPGSAPTATQGGEDAATASPGARRLSPGAPREAGAPGGARCRSLPRRSRAPAGPRSPHR